MPERSNGAAKQPHVSREQLQRRINELSAQLVETERALSAAKRERDENKISAAGASVSELEAQKSMAELVKDKEALRDALQVEKASFQAAALASHYVCVQQCFGRKHCKGRLERSALHVSLRMSLFQQRTLGCAAKTGRHSRCISVCLYARGTPIRGMRIVVVCRSSLTLHCLQTIQGAKAEAARLVEQATALRAEREAAQRAAAEAQRSVQTATADLQALQASHAHQRQQLQSQLVQLQTDSAGLQVCTALQTQTIVHAAVQHAAVHAALLHASGPCWLVCNSHHTGCTQDAGALSRLCYDICSRNVLSAQRICRHQQLMSI